MQRALRLTAASLNEATMSSNPENDSLVGLQNDDLDCDGLAMVVNDNCEFIFEG